MSYNLSVLASDIPANKEVALPQDRFFACGNVQELEKRMSELLKRGLTDAEKDDFHQQLTEKYNWAIIAEQTVGVYEKTARGQTKY